MWAKLALGAAAVSALIGCYGPPSPASQPVVSAPAPSTVVQSGVAKGIAAVAATYTLVSIDDHALPYARVYTKGPVPSPNASRERDTHRPAEWDVLDVDEVPRGRTPGRTVLRGSVHGSLRARR